MGAKDDLKRRTAEVNEILERFLPDEDGHQKTVLAAMNDSMRAGGKRVRPILMQETYRLFTMGKEQADCLPDESVIEPFMAAIEMIHTSSLIHDDLPCMDNDTLRRGRPTTWVKYGYDMAVLAGDALLIYAVETAARAFERMSCTDRVGRAISILAGKTGIFGMIGGQVVDVELTGRPIPREKLDFIYRLKTGALLEASMMIGAVLAGATEEEIRAVEEIASCVGLAFQIRDDILDVTATAQQLGKPVGSDEKNSKTTYVTLEGIEKAKADVAAISERAIGLLHGLPGSNPFLEDLIRMLATREN